jgi:histidinol dehydrogenase
MTGTFFPIHRAGTAGFRQRVAALRDRGEGEEAAVEQVVRGIIDEVKARGDTALADFTERFDGYRPGSLEIGPDAFAAARSEVAPELLSALEQAAERIRAFHLRQKRRSFTMIGPYGELLGSRVTPLARVGLYVPGGRAAYPSSVLMNAIPAKVAGVSEVVMVSPTPGGYLNPIILAAAGIAGVDRFFRVGGAQAVAALAYGTERVPQVDKIVGPGNIYVACAKRLVFGRVDIDMIAGPSEVIVVADASANPRHAAADLLSQAEHDPMAYPILIATSEEFAEQVRDELLAQLPSLSTAATATESLTRRGCALVVRSVGAACALASDLAPEHLELLVEGPKRYLSRIRSAGAIFLGPDTPEPVGDYIAGPNHVLPTGGTARFFSPLGVADFQKSSSVISFTPEALAALGPTVAAVADAEGLVAHARSITIRLEDRKKEKR